MIWQPRRPDRRTFGHAVPSSSRRVFAHFALRPLRSAPASRGLVGVVAGVDAVLFDFTEQGFFRDVGV